ncbi:MAG TPA: NifU family protein [Pseudonocardiaceae bacterium]|jgi:Fe-S cluster biogenesis protein NfuA/nitrite reductase/ring-hydroxylating ferredoxin subunit|nr:NifU family protein [Pseudonocardiaceae bacterium]
MFGVREVGARIEELLGALTAGRERAAAEELVSVLVDLYGDGLGRIVSVLGERDPALLAELADEPRVEGLLLLHGLHPLDVNARVSRALDRVRPYLGSHAGGVEFLGVDDDGVARLRLEGNCNGCPSSTLTVRLAIEGAVQDAAPEVTAVRVEGIAEPPSPGQKLLQIGMAPPPGWDAASDTAEAEPGWVHLPELGPPTGKPVIVPADGMRLVVCSVRGTLYAYRDACGACGATLADATLADAELTCPTCGAVFDVRMAGKSLTDNDDHLDPLPLLSDSRGTRVAVPAVRL